MFGVCSLILKFRGSENPPLGMARASPPQKPPKTIEKSMIRALELPGASPERSGTAQDHLKAPKSRSRPPSPASKTPGPASKTPCCVPGEQICVPGEQFSAPGEQFCLPREYKISEILLETWRGALHQRTWKRRNYVNPCSAISVYFRSVFRPPRAARGSA